MDPMYPNAYGQETLPPLDSTKRALSHVEKRMMLHFQALHFPCRTQSSLTTNLHG